MKKLECEQCSKPLIDCDVIIFAERWIFHDNDECFEEWIHEGKEYHLVDDEGDLL